MPPPPDETPATDIDAHAPSEPEAAPPPSRPRAVQVALVVGVVVAAVAMAWFALNQGSDENDPPVTLAGGGVSVTLPPGWQGTTDLSALPEIDGLTPPQTEAMQEWMDGVAADERVRLLAIDGFDSVAVLAVEDVGRVSLDEVVDVYLADGETGGFELLARGDTTVDGTPAATIESVNRTNGEQTYDVVWIEDGTIWIATWSTEVDGIEDLREDIDAAMASLTTT